MPTAISLMIGRVTVLLALSLLAAAPVAAQAIVNVYSFREPQLVRPLLKAFTEKTGIRTNFIYGTDGLIERIAAEGANSPADVLLTVDIGRLSDAKSKGISQALVSEAVNAAIPEAYRDPEGHWIGLTMRARVVYASKTRFHANTITYAELADPRWKGRVCMRSGQHTYNIGLLASIIANEGESKAEAWARGVKANLAHKPSGGDREQAKAIYAGECDLGVANTYYMAAMMTNTANPEQQKWAASVKLVFPNAHDRGTHVNISGAVLARHAPNRANAVRLIEFLASDEGQRLYANQVNEYPLRAGVPISPLVAGFGPLHADPIPLAQIAGLRRRASEIMDKVGFDAGPDY